MNIDSNLKVIYTKEQIQKRVRELGKEINNHYGDREYIIVAILKGSMYFLSDLSRHLSKKVIIDFMAISSYFGQVKKTLSAKVVLDININIQGKDVLIVEDIIDSGESLAVVLDMFKLRQPSSVKVVSLLLKDLKKREKEIPFKIDWLGFNVEDKFVIGYGLDYKNNYRNLESICCLDGEA